MKPHPHYVAQPKRFWAYVRLLSEKLGYTQRGTRQIKVHTLCELVKMLRSLDLSTKQLLGKGGEAREFGKQLVGYFRYRAESLNTKVEPRLMRAAQARALFYKSKRELAPACPLPMNKQKGKKRKPAYLTGLVNMVIEANASGLPCDYDPRALTTIIRSGSPLRTLARRVDGAFPSTTNPVAVWEIKEYYYTTTFGSRVADAVYETLLDGMELNELRDAEGVHVKHYLIVDAHYTWWDCGRSYLCRIFDMLHMGYVDEVLFGTEVIDRLPTLVKQWVRMVRARDKG